MGEPTSGPAPGDVPNEDDVDREFPVTDEGRPLREQTELVDDDGTDIRQYTGEPVPTDEGYVVPQQTVVGSERVVGGGEWPDAPERGPDERQQSDEREPSDEREDER